VSGVSGSLGNESEILKRCWRSGNFWYTYRR